MLSVNASSFKDYFRDAARPGDAAAVEALVRASGVFNEAEIVIARELVEEALAEGSDGSGYYFFFQDGAEGLEGYTCFGPIPATDRRYELFWIVVRESARGSKLAARLLGASEDRVREMGGAMIFAETSIRADYIAADKFYRAQGYTLMADIADWHADGDGLAVFGKRLNR